jgi:hypothetical protein
VEVRNAVLDEQTDEVEPTNGEFTLGRLEDGAIYTISVYETMGLRRVGEDSPEVVVERLQLREVAVKRGHVSRPYTPERSDLEYFACERHGHGEVVGEVREQCSRAITSSRVLYSPWGKMSPVSINTT